MAGLVSVDETDMNAKRREPRVLARWRTPADPHAYRLKMLSRTELVTRRRFIASKLVAVGALVVWLAAIVAAVRLLDGPLKWILVAVFALTFPAVLPADLFQRYGAYAAEWEEANGGAAR